MNDRYDNVGAEYHETERRILSDKDVFYLCIIGWLLAVWLGR